MNLPLNSFAQDSATNEGIRSLSIALLVIIILVFLVVWGLLAITILRYRRRPEQEAWQIEGNRRIEILWTAIPFVLVSVLFGLTLSSMSRLSPGKNDPVMTVVGHQWWWEAQYPEQGFSSPNEFHIPAAEAVEIALKSADVIHSFWVPRLGGKFDTTPGRVARARYEAPKAGWYLGVCGEFCGKQHAHMRFYLVVESEAEYAEWVRAQAAPAAEPTTEPGRRGRDWFLKSACIGCHTVRGTTATGVSGPDLTHLGSRKTIVAVTLPNNGPNLTHWIADPQKVKPGSLMPAVPMSDTERADLVAYLTELK